MTDLKKNLIREKANIKEALSMLDKAHLKILFVVDDADKLIGAVTDGDVRRGFLKGVTVESPIHAVMNTDPVVKEVGKALNFSKLKGRGVAIVPVIDDQGRLLRIEEVCGGGEPIENRAVIMAGGLGSRLGDLTKDLPKPMLKIGDKPILQIIMERLNHFGISHFYLSVNYKSDVIKDYFKDGSDFGWTVNYIEEPKRMGTAGSLRLFEDHKDLPFFVLNGDIISDVNISSLLGSHNTQETDFTICVKDYSVTVPFGVVKSENGFITDLEEKPKVSFDISAGFYVVSPHCLGHMPESEFVDMPTFIRALLTDGKKVRSFSIDEYWIDVGRHDDLAKAKKEIKGT